MIRHTIMRPTVDAPARPLSAAGHARRHGRPGARPVGAIPLAAQEQAEGPKFGADAMPQRLARRPEGLRRDRRRTAPSPSPATAPRWARACAPRSPMVVADELEADWAQGARRPGLGRRGALRQPGHRRLALACATSSAACAMPARPRALMLEQAAAKQWGVPVDRGHGREPRGRPRQVEARALGYGELAAAAAELPVPARESVRLKEPERASATSARTRSA